MGLVEREIMISDIRLDGDTQARVNIDADLVDEYAAAMQGGSVFPKVRPQAVAKEVLNQSQCLFLFQTLGAQEADALAKWVGKDVPKGTLDQLKAFDVGECFVWSPAWLKRFERTRFERKMTYDSTKTPEFGANGVVKEPTPIDLKGISSAMAATIERAKENDPDALRAEVTRLKAELARKPATVPGSVVTQEKSVITPSDWDVIQKLNTRLTNTIHENAELKRLHEEHLAEYREGIAGLKQSVESCGRTADELSELVRAAVARVPSLATPRPMHAPMPTRDDVTRFSPRSNDPIPGLHAGDENQLRKGARSMLEAIASLDPQPVSRDQVAVLAGLTATSGTFSAYLGDLRRLDLILERGSEMILSVKGRERALGNGRPLLKTHEELVAMWSRDLRRGARSMLDVLVDVWPKEISRVELARRVSIVETSGTFSAYLGDLRKRGIMDDVSRGSVRANDSLFPHPR